MLTARVPTAFLVLPNFHSCFYNSILNTVHVFNFLRWHDTLKYGDAHEKFNFMKIEDLRPLNTSQNHFQTILPNFPVDECEI